MESLLRTWLWLWVILLVLLSSFFIVLLFVFINRWLSRSGKLSLSIRTLEPGSRPKTQSQQIQMSQSPAASSVKASPSLPPRSRFMTRELMVSSYENLSDAADQPGPDEERRLRFESSLQPHTQTRPQFQSQTQPQFQSQTQPQFQSQLQTRPQPQFQSQFQSRPEPQFQPQFQSQSDYLELEQGPAEPDPQPDEEEEEDYDDIGVEEDEEDEVYDDVG